MTKAERACAMLAFFRTHEWLQSELIHWNREGDVIAACLAGAEAEVAGDWNVVTPAVGMIVAAEFRDRIEPQWERHEGKGNYRVAAVLFNNSKQTTRADILSLLERVASSADVPERVKVGV